MVCTFSDLGGELISAKSSDGTEFIWQGHERSWKKHAPSLFPICGRLKDSAYTYGGKEYTMGCHGFLSKSEMTLVESSDEELVFELRSSEKTKESYPFDFVLTLTYTLKGTTLSAKCEVENTSEELLPFMFGGHPGFSTSVDGLSLCDFYVDFGAEGADLYPIINNAFISKTAEHYSFSEGIYPLTREALVEAKTVVFKNAPKEITLASAKSAHKVLLSYSETLPYMCIWSDQADEAEFVCLEPWSGVPNDGVSDECFETRESMVRLAPGKSESFEYKMTFI